jgi:transcription-repair coupling factor (superfamily II helicase)
LSSVEQVDELLDIKDEFTDRYGQLPQEAINLFEVLALKTLLRRLYIIRLEQGPANLVFSFHEKTPVSPEKILRLLEKYKNQARFTPEARLIVATEPGILPETTLRNAQKILDLLAEDDI